MFLALAAVVVGFAALFWSAERFVRGSAGTARHFNLPPLLIGMVIVGFGTSVPEMVVSTLSAYQGSPELALGNAYGSNITNIALILGFTALINPIEVHSSVLRKELPLLTALTVVAAWQAWDGTLTRLDAAILLALFLGILGWTFRQSFRAKDDPLAEEMEQALKGPVAPLRNSLVNMAIGLAVLVVSSRILVWGAVTIAEAMGVSELVIGLTVVALGTSLPELASSVVAAYRGEHDIALGNVLGSNLFNTLAVVGLAGLIQPLRVAPEVLYRDFPVMAALTLSLFLFGFDFKGRRVINRFEASVLLAAYMAYTTWLFLPTA